MRLVEMHHHHDAEGEGGGFSRWAKDAGSFRSAGAEDGADGGNGDSRDHSYDRGADAEEEEVRRRKESRRIWSSFGYYDRTRMKYVYIARMFRFR